MSTEVLADATNLVRLQVGCAYAMSTEGCCVEEACRPAVSEQVPRLVSAELAHSANSTRAERDDDRLWEEVEDVLLGPPGRH